MTEPVRPYLGLDIGGTRTKACVVDFESMSVIDTSIQDTRGTLGHEVVIEDAILLGKELGGKVENPILGVGIAACGPTDVRTGTVIESPILPDWRDVVVAPKIGEALQLPAIVDNDGNLALLGEATLGAGRGMKHIVGFTLGTGVGGGMIIAGELVRGGHWYGGEVGHMTVNPDGLECPCGNRGCLNVEAASTTLERRYFDAKQARLSAEAILLQAKNGDSTSLACAEPMFDALAIGISNLVNAVDPEGVVLSGGPTRLGDWLVSLIKRNVERRLYSKLFGSLSIQLGQLLDFGSSAGAAVLIGLEVESEERRRSGRRPRVLGNAPTG